ncbi:MAG: PLD nuclease N-terminal domain-containing protein [Acidimicrobiia bacterium]
MLTLAEDFTFGHFLLGVLYIFAFVVWFWLIITVFADMFRRHDISGWMKAAWVIFIILLPYLGVFVYLITQGRGMAERSQQQAVRARAEMRDYLGVGLADEIDKLERLKSEGKLSDDEYQRLRARLVT